ncbi:hypothetical protein [Desulfoluna sp.]|uniref:hypothetical protein n=1 Tax=Desulfoluna sp. TaxID=2045199 RepID=UPI0026166C28|nr:hypothetical protein [Desulfoluna sp.]
MSERYTQSKAGMSGQRSGRNRRERDVPPPEGVDRRKPQDRREQWSHLNEWSSPLNRRDGAGETSGS